MNIHAQIDQIMKEKGLSDADLAELTGLPRMTIGNARRGKNILLANAFRISKALGKPLDQIWAIKKPESEVSEEEEVA